MAPLANRSRGLGIGLAAVALAGCATTQQQAARLRVVSARDRATEQAVRVSRADPAVAASATLVRSATGAAIVVRLRNLSDRTVSDLPITVAVREAGGRERVLNGASGLDYFLTHIPGIAPRGRLIWVFPTARRPPGGAPVVRVGFPAAGAGSVSAADGALPSALPRIAVSLVAAPRHGAVEVTVRNLSDVPQYELPVYAAAQRSGAYTAAARAAIGELDGGSTQQLRLALLGNARGSAVTFQAGPTELR